MQSWCGGTDQGGEAQAYMQARERTGHTIGSRRETGEVSRKRMNLETVLDLAPASALAELPSLVRGRIKTLMPLSPAQPSAHPG